MRIALYMDSVELRAAMAEHGRAVFSLAYRLCADRALAEEVAQDVFVELWRCRTPPEVPEHRGAWLRKVAVHRALDAVRRRRRQPELWAEPGEAEELESAGGGGLPCVVSDRLEGMLASLPDAMRMALVLRYGEDEQTPEEIGRLLGQPVATVKSNLARGLALLRRKARVRLKEFVREG